METKYNIVKTVNGRKGKVTDTFTNLEDAREELALQLRNAADDDYNFFAGEAEAIKEIEFAEGVRGSWGDRRVDNYIDALRRGIASGCPFIADSTSGDCITTQYDSFSYDNYSVEIIEEEEE